MKSDNIDLAWEIERGRRSAFAFTAFAKRVRGFPERVISQEMHDGIRYSVSRPQNSLPARIRGIEIAGEQFVDGGGLLPADLGVQATYTWIGSSTPNRALGRDRPLQNLSRHNTNVVLIAERPEWSARSAWNWRSRFLTGLLTLVDASAESGVRTFEQYTRSYGWLDASFSWHISDRLTLWLEGSNLTRTLRTGDFGSGSAVQSAWLNDRRYAVALSLHH